MKRKQLKSAGRFTTDKDGKEIPFDPKERMGIANASAAAIKSIDTGEMYKVVSA